MSSKFVVIGGGAAGIAAARRLLDSGVDVLLLPSCARGPYEAGTFTRHGTAWWLAFASDRIPFFPAFNLTGTPAANVPAGTDADGLPVGVQLAGPPRSEALLLSLSAQLEAARRESTFEEVTHGLSAETALYEARRCMSCGSCFSCDNCYGVCPDNAVLKIGRPGERYEIDLDYCKGCGLCAAECPCGAIEMVPEQI